MYEDHPEATFAVYGENYPENHFIAGEFRHCTDRARTEMGKCVAPKEAISIDQERQQMPRKRDLATDARGLGRFFGQIEAIHSVTVLSIGQSQH